MHAPIVSDRRSRLASLALALGGLVPMLCAMGFHFAGPRPQSSTPRGTRPALSFDQYAVDLGRVPASRTAQARFRFTNHGSQPVRVTRVEPSCGCLTPRLDKTEYAPGEIGQFFLQVDTAAQKSGPQEFWVKVHYTDPQPRETKLLFKLDLPEQRVTVSPRALVFYQLGSQPISQDVYVTDHRHRPLRVLSAKSPVDYVDAKVAETATDESGGQRTRVVVTVAADVPEGLHEPLLKITTDDPVYKTLFVPLRVSGRR
jgi:hypothetical protein